MSQGALHIIIPVCWIVHSSIARLCSFPSILFKLCVWEGLGDLLSSEQGYDSAPLPGREGETSTPSSGFPLGQSTMSAMLEHCWAT